MTILDSSPWTLERTDGVSTLQIAKKLNEKEIEEWIRGNVLNFAVISHPASGRYIRFDVRLDGDCVVKDEGHPPPWLQAQVMPLTSLCGQSQAGLWLCVTTSRIQEACSDEGQKT